mgnify:FL=1|jgi:hypothetical protein|nr:MAG TPA: hypothetical protein [Caudoviricetes sp.]
MKEITDNIVFDKRNRAQVMRDGAQIQECSEKDKVLKYLKSFDVECVSSGYVYDSVKKEYTNVGIKGYTDGEYGWGSSQIYYFENYDIKLSDAFIKKAIGV